MKKSIIIILVFILLIGAFFIMKNIINIDTEQQKQQIFDEEMFINGSKNRKDLQTGDSYTVILYEDGSVWVAGANYHYSSRNGYQYGMQVEKFSKLKLNNIEQIAVGSNFVIALDKDGYIYSWGGNEYGQLGRNTINDISDIPTKLEVENIKKIYVNNFQVVALSNDNTAYYFGYASNSKYYNGENKILKIDNYEITDVFLTGYRYYFKTSEKDKYQVVGHSCGGITDQINGWAREPVEIEISNVSKIVGYPNIDEDFIIKNDGNVYSIKTKESKEIKETDFNKYITNIKDIIFTEYTKSNEGYTYFAIDEKNNLYYKNTFVLDNINIVANGIENRNNLLLKQDGTVYNMGFTIDNLSETEPYTDYFTIQAKKINIENVKIVSVAKKYAIIVDNNNTIYRLGKSDNGALGIKADETIKEFNSTNRYR